MDPWQHGREKDIHTDGHRINCSLQSCLKKRKRSPLVCRLLCVKNMNYTKIYYCLLFIQEQIWHFWSNVECKLYFSSLSTWCRRAAYNLLNRPIKQSLGKDSVHWRRMPFLTGSSAVHLFEFCRSLQIKSDVLFLTFVASSSKQLWLGSRSIILQDVRVTNLICHLLL